jgi:hypothetical protein
MPLPFPSHTFDTAINSFHTFSNHECNGKYNMADVDEVYPWLDDIGDRWDPVASRIFGELDHGTIAVRDIKKGEMM